MTRIHNCFGFAQMLTNSFRNINFIIPSTRTVRRLNAGSLVVVDDRGRRADLKDGRAVDDGRVGVGGDGSLGDEHVSLTSKTLGDSGGDFVTCKK